LDTIPESWKKGVLLTNKHDKLTSHSPNFCYSLGLRKLLNLSTLVRASGLPKNQETNNLTGPRAKTRVELEPSLFAIIQNDGLNPCGGLSRGRGREGEQDNLLKEHGLSWRDILNFGGGIFS
jgi:hypothetical protein